jgi:predicted kinase
MSKLILVSGPSGSGKTYLAKYLSDQLNIPYFSKDQIKEELFDYLGWSNKEWSHKLGGTAILLMYSIIEKEIKFGRDVIAEANFKPNLDIDRIKKYQEQNKLDVIELHCSADKDILIKRVAQRFEKGERHPGHLDNKLEDQYFDPSIHGAVGVGKVIQVDTSDFSKVDYQGLVNQISN